MEKAFEFSTTPSPIWRPHLHDRICVFGHLADGSPVAFSLLGIHHSELKSGPSLFTIADIGGELCGNGSYGLSYTRYLGFREVGK